VKEAQEVPNKNSIAKTTSRLFTPTLRLFKALPVINSNRIDKKASDRLQRATIQHGFIFAPVVLSNYTEAELLALVDTVANEVGLSAEQMNASFHKSWAKVRDAPIMQLIVEQLVHYFTTYGFEALGIYSEDSVYIPNEKLQIPDLKDGINVAVIHGYTLVQLKEKLLQMLNSGLALKEQTLEDVVVIGTACGIAENELAQIKNKEVRTMLYTKLDIMPEMPVEFLRLIVYETTGKTLLIVNKDTIEAIKKSDLPIAYYFAKYDSIYGFKRLAEIFLRFKPLFLALKNKKAMKPVINRIRKLADKYHVPMHPDLLNNVTAILARGESIEKYGSLQDALDNASTFRKIRLLYALNYRLAGPTSIMHKIRNGKAYSKPFTFPFEHIHAVEDAYRLVLQSIVADVRNNVNGKKIYIPNGIKYALPATQKQFTGNLPSGSSITTTGDMVAGVYWENVRGQRIDLDLSAMSIADGKVGWDAKYRSNGILFSGDLTNATNGASELLRVSAGQDDIIVIMINYFNYNESIPVPFKTMTGKAEISGFNSYCLVDPNKVLCIAKSEIKTKQKMLGLLVVTQTSCTFYFSETGIGNRITASGRNYLDWARNYIVKYVINAPSLNQVLEMAGAELVGEKGNDVMDLSPEAIEVDTIVNLLK